ncbi:MAG: DUF1638 domain-containing protein [Syntrophobacteria bacterium]
MKKRKILIACNVFEKELRACLPNEGEPEIIWIDAGLHADLPRLEEQLTKALEKSQGRAAEVQVFFGSGCHPDICRLARRFSAGIAPVKNCIEAFCGENAKKLEENRTMIMTPGWVRAWPRIMEALGWDEVDVRINLGRYDRILLLDAGVDPLSEEEILSFFDLVQVPIEIDSLNLDHFKCTLAAVLR